METETDLNVELDTTNPHETRDRFVKLIVGTAAGFIAGRIVENLYDKLIIERRANRL